MAATQSTLNDFFKSKRSARDGLAIKGGKNVLLSRENTDLADSPIENGKYNQSEETISVPEVTTIKLAVKPKAVRRVRVAARPKTPVASENIAAAFQRAATKKLTAKSLNENVQDQTISLLQASSDTTSSCKRSRDESEGDDGCTSQDTVDDQLSVLPTQGNATPIKNQNCDEPLQRKRHKTATDQSSAVDDVRTPDSKTITSCLRTTRGSARKKLEMGKCETGSSSSSDGSSLKLQPCKKLSDLRAQLMRVNQCESRLQQFRDTVVLPSTHEAEQAAALVLKSKGGLPSASMIASPLKSASPRKVFSPHKTTSPYKPPASPRKPPPHPQLQLFNSLEVVVPVSPKKTPLKSPRLEEPQLPAYQRYHHLVQDTPPPAAAAAGEGQETGAPTSSELALPYSYRLLREVFRAVDTVVSLMHNRQEVITFSKLKPAVQQMLRRTFHERNLGQVSRVFPLAYFFRQDKIRPGVSSIAASGTPNKSGYQLIIAANLNYQEPLPGPEQASLTPASAKTNLLARFDSATPAAPAVAPSVSTKQAYSGANSKTRKMDSQVMVERRTLFHKALVDAVHKHHTEFLKSLEPGVALPPAAAIRRWHPSFPLDEVPDIEPAPLPQPPHQDVLSNATDVLAAARGLFSKNPRMEAAMEQAAEKHKSSSSSTSSAGAGAVQGSVTSTAIKTASAAVPAAKVQLAAQTPEVALALRGISVSLLEKIRAREAAAANRAMVRSASDNKQLAQLSRLPELARILRHSMVSERKAALHWDAALSTLRESHPGMLSAGELEDHLELLLKEMPSWITKHKLSSGIFLKINKNADFSSVVEKLQAIVKQKS